MATISGHSFNIGSYGKYVQKSSPLKPVSQFKAWMVLKWSIFKIVSGDPDLHPRWPPSADIPYFTDDRSIFFFPQRSGSLDIILKVDHLRTIHAMSALNWLTGFRGNFV
jgi:hypothetical protein